jgi:hypothetical protein
MAERDGRAAATRIELEATRLVEHERALVAAFDEIAFAARFGGAEEIVEIGAVPPEASAPVVSLVFGVEMEALVGRERAGWRYVAVTAARLSCSESEKFNRFPAAPALL